MIGANPTAIELAEDRQKFKDAMHQIGLKCPKSYVVNNLDDAEIILSDWIKRNPTDDNAKKILDEVRSGG